MESSGIKFLSDQFEHLIIETEDGKPIATITMNDVEVATGYQVRTKPV